MGIIGPASVHTAQILLTQKHSLTLTQVKSFFFPVIQALYVILMLYIGWLWCLKKMTEIESFTHKEDINLVIQASCIDS